MITNKLQFGLRAGLLGVLFVVAFALTFWGTAREAHAQALTFDCNTNIEIGGNNYVIASGSEATSVVVSATDVVVVVPAASTFTLSSNAGFTLTNDQSVSQTCSANTSSIAYTGAGTITVTPTTVVACAVVTSGGGGGGGGGGSTPKATPATPATPANPAPSGTPATPATPATSATPSSGASSG